LLPIWRAEAWDLVKFTWNPRFLEACWRVIQRLARRGGVEVLYCRDYEVARVLFERAFDFDVRTVFEVHTLRSVEAEEEGGDVEALREDERRAIETADLVVATGEALREQVERRFDLRRPVVTVPNGVRVPPQQPPRAPDPEQPVLLYVGQLQAWKGVQNLVRALSLLPRVRLEIVGGIPERDPKRESLQALAVETGVAERVAWTGFLRPEQVADHLRRATVAVHPLAKSVEGRLFTSPLKVLEYMAAGLPIVASDLPSTRQILRHDETALLVPPEDPQALAAAIRRLLDSPDLAQRLGAAAYQAARQFSWSERARRILAALSPLARNPASAGAPPH
jgi:glycosyltransferase involved in cell wall biosynthesis